MTAPRRAIERAAGRAPSRAALLLAWLAWSSACATSGTGSNPPLPNGPASTGDDGAVAANDDATAGPPGDDADMADGASTCNDALHGLRALFVLPPVACTSSTDCASGSCCFVGPSSSTCVMQ
jgi:hypothetical protein